MNKKFIIGAIIALVLILGGGVGYYYYNQASADAYTKDFCNGIQGQTWRNCVQNMASWKAYMQKVDNTRFKQMVNTADKNRKVTAVAPVVKTTDPATPVKPSTPANHDADTVKIFTTTTTSTTPIVLGLGSYTKEQLVAKNIDPSTIQSFQLVGGYTLTAYKTADLTGTDKIVWDRNTVISTLSWKGAIASFKVEKNSDTPVIVYTKGGFDGNSVALKVGDYNEAALTALGISPKTISSIIMTSDASGKETTDYTVKLYAASDLTGTSVDVTKTNGNLTTAPINFNDQAASLKVVKN